MKKLFVVCCLLGLISIACNFPSVISRQEPTPTSNPTAAVQENFPTQTPEQLKTDLPTVTMPGGTGYIFSTQAITSGPEVDRDVWWNAAEFVPDKRMVSLGLISSPADVNEISTAEMAFGGFEPQIGEGFAIEIQRDDQTSYAIIRVLSIVESADNVTITFDWVYPFRSNVIVP